MNRRFLSVGSLALVAVILGAAATAPKTTYDVIMTPKRAVLKKQRAAKKDRAAAEWSRLAALAASGDVEAQAQVGSWMVKPNGYRYVGLASNPELGERYLREAAAAGHPLGRYHVWRLEGRTDTTAVLDLFHELDAADGRFQYPMVRSEVSMIATARCDLALLEETHRSWEEDIALWEKESGKKLGDQAREWAERDTYLFNKVCSADSYS